MLARAASVAEQLGCRVARGREKQVELLAFAVDAGGAGHAIGMFVEMPTGREGKG